MGDAVTLAVRPENLRLRSDSEPGAVPVTLAASAFWGHTTYYRVTAEGADAESLDVAQQDYRGPEYWGSVILPLAFLTGLIFTEVAVWLETNNKPNNQAKIIAGIIM